MNVTKFLKTAALAVFVMVLAAGVASGQTITNYPNGFPNGVTLQNVPILNTYGGNVFWVDSGAGSNGNKGTFSMPFGTLDYAVGRCTANNGDIIMIKPGHTEALTDSSALNLDVAGVLIFGLGTGSNRPTFTLGTATYTDVDVDAANINIVNCVFTNGIDHLSHMLDINAANCGLYDIEIDNNDSTYVSLDDAVITDANADGLVIDGFTYKGYNQPAAADTVKSAICIVGGNDITIKNFNIDGYFDEACIENVTTAAVNLNIYNDTVGYLRNRFGDDVCITCVTTTTGFQGPNIYARLADNAANVTEAFVGADMQFMQPISIVNADGESSLNTNITATADE